MARAPAAAFCYECGHDFEAVPVSSKLGFDKFACPQCKAKVLRPLAPWKRTAYWVFAVPCAGLIAWSFWLLLHRPGVLGGEDLFRIPRLFFIWPATALCIDRFYRRRDGAVAAAPEPGKRLEMAKFIGSWKRSPEFAIMWLLFAAVYVPLFGLNYYVSQKIRTLGHQAAMGFKSGDYRASAAALDGLVKMGLDERTPDLLAQRSYARALSGDFDGATNDADAILKRQPGMVLALVTRCVVAESSKKYQEAVSRCADALAKVPPGQNGLLVAVRTRLGSAKFSLDDYTGARDEYSAVIALTPSVPTSYVNRAMVAVMIGPQDQGQADLKKAMELDASIKPDKLGPAAMLLSAQFEPIIELSLRRGREALAALAAAELDRFAAKKSWSLSLDELLEGRADAETLRAQTAGAFDGGAVAISATGDGLSLSGRARGSKREVTASGTPAGFTVPELRWESGDFPEQRIAPPKPKKARRPVKKRR